MDEFGRFKEKTENTVNSDTEYTRTKNKWPHDCLTEAGKLKQKCKITCNEKLKLFGLIINDKIVR